MNLSNQTESPLEVSVGHHMVQYHVSYAIMGLPGHEPIMSI